MKLKKIIENSDFQTKKTKLKKIEIKNEKIHKILINKITKMYEPDFIGDSYISEKYQNLFLYFTGNNKSKYDINKGLWLVGNSGSGKTLAMKVFKKYTCEFLKKNSFVCTSFEKIISDYKKEGQTSFDKFGYNYGRPGVFYIDDFLDQRQNIKHFANEVNIAEMLIRERKSIFDNFGKLTHLTTNIKPNQVSDFDIRIIGRINKMFNIVEFEHENFNFK